MGMVASWRELVPRSRESFLILGIQLGAIAAASIQPYLPLLILGGLALVAVMVHFSQLLLVILADIGLIKGALISSIPMLETLDISVISSGLLGIILLVKLSNRSNLEHLRQFQWLITSFFIWLLWMIIASVYAPQLDWALYKSFRFAFFTSVLFVAPLLLIRTQTQSKMILRIFLLIGILGAIYLFAQLILYVGAAPSLRNVYRLTILQANPIGASRILCICAAMSAMAVVTDLGSKIRWSVAFVVFLAAALMTGSRGPILSMAAAILIIGTLLGGPARKKTLIITAIAVSIAGLVIILAPQDLTYRYRLYTAGEFGLTTQGLRVYSTITHRFLLWEKAIDLWIHNARHFLIGSGTAGYANLFIWRDWRYPHNILLELLVEFGIVGTAVFILHLVIAARMIIIRFRQNYTLEEVMWLAGLATIFISTFVSGDLNDNRLIWFFLASLIASVVCRVPMKSTHSPGYQESSVRI